MPTMQPKNDYKAAWLLAWGNSSIALRDFEQAWNARIAAYNAQYGAASADEAADMDGQLAVVTAAEATRDYGAAIAELNRWRVDPPALPDIREKHARRQARLEASDTVAGQERKLDGLPEDLATPIRIRLQAARRVIDDQGSSAIALQQLRGEFESAAGMLEAAEDELRAREDRRQTARLHLLSMTSFVVPKTWDSPQATRAREAIDRIRSLLGTVEGLPTLVLSALQLSQAESAYETLTAAYSEAERVHALAQETEALRSRLRLLLAEVDQRLQGLRGPLADGFRERLLRPRQTLDDPGSPLRSLAGAESLLLEVDAESLACALEDKDVGDIATRIGQLSLPGDATAAHLKAFQSLRAGQLVALRTANLLAARKALAALEGEVERITREIASERERLREALLKLSSGQAEPRPSEADVMRLEASLTLDDLTRMERTVGLGALVTLSVAFTPDPGQADLAAGVVAFKAFVDQALGGDANLKTLLEQGCKGSIERLAAFGQAFKDDPSGLGRLLGVGTAEATDGISAGALAALLEPACGGDPTMIRAMTKGLCADSPEAAAERTRMRTLLDAGGLGGAPTLLASFAPGGDQAAEDRGQAFARSLGELAKAFSGKRGAERMRTLLGAGFAPDPKSPAQDRVKVSCLADLLRDGLGGDAGKLAALAAQLDTEGMAEEIQALRETKASLLSEADALETADGSKDTKRKKREQAASRRERATEIDAAIERLKSRRQLAEQGHFKNLLLNGGLGQQPAVLAQVAKTGCGGDPARLLALADAFVDNVSRANLKAAINEGGLGGRPGEDPALLGDVLGTGLSGDPKKLKDLVGAFGPAGSARLQQLEQMIGIYKAPPHGPPPSGPGEQIKILLDARHLNGDAGKLQTQFTAKMASIAPVERRRKAISWAPSFGKAAVPAGTTDNAAVSATAAAASGMTRARIEHFLTRHTAGHFDFGVIKDRNAAWPPDTDPTELAALVDQALAQWVSADQAPLDVTKKLLLLDLPAGKKVGVQAAWNGDKLTQFFPLTLAQAKAQWPALVEADYMADIENFPMSEMEKIRDALMP